MAHVQTPFHSGAQGFQFPNRFEFKFPVKFPLPPFGTIDLSQLVFGLCGGMCFSALDYFHANETPPQVANVNEIDKKLFGYLCERQLDSLKISVVFKVLEWMLLDDREVATRMARYEIPKLRRMLDKGEPAVLALLRVKNIDHPSLNHQVLATGYEDDLASRKMVVTVYDPNHPGEEPTLALTPASRGSGMQLSQSTGEFLRGFFVIPYQKRTTFPRVRPQVDLFSFGITETPSFRLRWPVDSRRVNQHFGKNPESYRPFGLPGHEGLDLFAPSGANIYAAADGEVYEVGHPKDHPYGLHIRIKHQAGGKTFRTVYAHLSKTVARVGQKVSAGDLIGLADNTGNSFGSHLHLTLKIDGAQTPGYPKEIVDPWPYLQEEAGPPGELPPSPSGLTVYTNSQVTLRAEPKPGAKALGMLPAGEALIVLGDAAAARGKIGNQAQWLQVQTAGGQAGFVEGNLVEDTQRDIPPTDLVVYPFDQVNLRSGPSTTFNLLATLTMNDPLTVLGDDESARAKLGRENQWIQVQTEAGQRGFVAAWLVHLTGQAAPPSGLTVFPTAVLNVRARPSTDASILSVVAPGDALAILGDKSQAQAHIGQQDQWLNVRTPSKIAGYVAAWMVQATNGAPPQPAPASTTLSVFPTGDVNMRAQPSTNSPRVSGAFRNEKMLVLESDLIAAKAKIGMQDAWIFAQNKNGHRGWVAAWFLSEKPV
jgi:uncharacterized protein YgiM (DUF1202 family)